jgi:ATP-dependent exoDNAse (exonuclease V) alpha subunit
MDLDYTKRVFQPKSLADKNLAIKKARALERYHEVAVMENQWVDLRGAYACTINKAQGSTFGSVYLDLDDISRCNNGETIARMLYVAVSRARHHVFLT